MYARLYESDDVWRVDVRVFIPKEWVRNRESERTLLRDQSHLLRSTRKFVTVLCSSKLRSCQCPTAKSQNGTGKGEQFAKKAAQWD